MAPSQEPSEYDQSLTDYILKSRRLRTTVLPVESVSQSLQERYETNATTCHLFRIPPELRNRIYRLVIADKEIHISGCNPRNVSEARLDVKRKFFRSICQRQTTELEDARALKACQNMKSREDYHQRHRQCHRSSESTSDFNLSFLSVCRQIHQEAALMPFQENTFIFNKIIDLEGFIELQIPAQVAAIQHISFEYHQFSSNEAFENRLQKKLGKLKDLIVFHNETLSTLPATVDEDDPAGGSMLRFRRVKIEQATFAAYNDYRQARSDEQWKSALEWARFMEAALMKEWVDLEAGKEPVAGNGGVAEMKKGKKGKQTGKADKAKRKRAPGRSKVAKKSSV